MAYGQPASDPDPTTAQGVIAGFAEGIALAFVNKIVVVVFAQLAAVQQTLNPEQTLVDLGTIFTAWGIAYFVLAYIAPVLAAYVWADKAGVAVYFIGWMGTTLFLSGSFTVGMVLLVVACFLVFIVDLLKNASGRDGIQPPVR
jgi:hypothetical protein